MDFYCAALRLVVEIDGSRHYEPDTREADDVRTAYLNSIGLRVVRFSNHDVDVNFNGVCATIDRIIREEM